MTTLAHHTDYAPAFSPDGRRVAYLRGSVVIVSDIQGITISRPIQVSLRVINLDGTGDRSIADFNPGMFSNQVSWSPDGRQLVFDLGRQPAPQPLQGPPLIALPETLELHIVNADGSGMRRLRGAAAGTPAWLPTAAGPGVAPALPAITHNRLRNGNLRLAWPVNADGFVLQTVPALGAKVPWTNVPENQIQTEAENRTAEFEFSGSHRFFRLFRGE
jgi:hypothetical protein